MICTSTVTQGNLVNVLLASSYLSTDLLDQVSLMKDTKIFTSMDKLVIHPISHIPLPVLVTTLATNLLLSGFMKLREG